MCSIGFYLKGWECKYNLVFIAYLFRQLYGEDQSKKELVHLIFNHSCYWIHIIVSN